MAASSTETRGGERTRVATAWRVAPGDAPHTRALDAAWLQRPRTPRSLGSVPHCRVRNLGAGRHPYPWRGIPGLVSPRSRGDSERYFNLANSREVGLSECAYLACQRGFRGTPAWDPFSAAPPPCPLRVPGFGGTLTEAHSVSLRTAE